MRRKLLLPALAACCLLAVGAPLASARTHRAHAAKSQIASKVHKLGVKLSGIGGTVLGIQHGIKVLQDIDLGQTAAINQSIADHTTLKGTVDAIVAGVPAIIDGLTQLKNGLTTVGGGLTTLAGVVQNTIGPGLTALSAAVQDPTTGLVGLNAVRPQYGAFNADGTIIGGTGQTTGASGPSTGSIHNATGAYIVNFGNDVSNRALSVNPFPASAAPIGEAVDCASNGTATATCTALNGGTALTNPQNYVLVTIEDHSGTQCVRDPAVNSGATCDGTNKFVGGTVTAANQPFSVMAIHG